MSSLSDLSQKQLISMINELKEENWKKFVEICLLKTELNENKNESNKRQKSSGSEALDRQTVNKKLCLSCVSQKRQSFSERFCDDLCEEILQYLSLEDKLRLQCVSKQFQRTVFQRQYELFINIVSDEAKYYWKYKYCINSRDNYFYFKDQSLDSFKALLKKCPNITSIELTKGFFSDYPDKVNQIFPIVIENCNNLSEVILNDHINDNNFEEFHRKFGPKIKYLKFNREVIDFNHFPNIEKIEINDRFLTNHSIIPQLKLPKLKKLRIVLEEHEEHMLPIFIDTFPTLTHLEVYPYSEDENPTYKPLKNISNLKHLIHFKLFNEYGIKNNTFCGLLKQMANNCQNLKSIECYFVINNDNSDIRQLLSLLKVFPLKRLIFSLPFVDNEGEDNIDVNQLFSFELFKGFENITHLSLHFGFTQTLKESILKDIDINLPNLQYLEIENRFDTTPEGVTQMADILSRLSRLQTIELQFKSGVNFKPIEEQITEKCRKIDKIYLSFSFKVALIQIDIIQKLDKIID